MKKQLFLIIFKKKTYANARKKPHVATPLIIGMDPKYLATRTKSLCVD
jgi:hypothetical protein